MGEVDVSDLVLMVKGNEQSPVSDWDIPWHGSWLSPIPDNRPAIRRAGNDVIGLESFVL
jgi:hypothetical protein